MSTDLYTHDVFVSYSSKDKVVVSAIAERLRADGLRVWFDDWELKPGDSIPAKIEQGLEQSRVLVLCLSANALGSDWAALESGTFRFRDPLNKDRRFIPLRLDDTPIEGSLTQFVFINWFAEESGQEYLKILKACRSPAKPSAMRIETAPELIAEKTIQLDCNSSVHTCVFSQDGKHAITGSNDQTIRLWDVEAGCVLLILKGHTGRIRCLLWSSDQKFVLSGSDDKTIRLWNVETGTCINVFREHSHWIMSLAWNTDYTLAISGSNNHVVNFWDLQSGYCISSLKGYKGAVRSIVLEDNARYALLGLNNKTVQLWDIEMGRCLRVLEGHSSEVFVVAWDTERGLALSGSKDRTVRLWDLKTGYCLYVLRGHRARVTSLAWSKNGRFVLSGSGDDTLRLWDLETGHCLCVLKGHMGAPRGVAWSEDQCRAFSCDSKGGIRIWDLSKFVSIPRTSKGTLPVPSIEPDQILYTNAKVLLVGDSGVGKTGLSNYLALNIKDDEYNTSTDGAWATQWTLPHTVDQNGVEREIWLWDFAGQVDYRLVHQLYMDDTAAAVLVFNPQNENPFEGLGQWDSDLQKASRKPYAKLLAAGRIDRGGLIVSGASMDKFMAERGFRPPLYLTSAKTGEGCEELHAAIVEAIDWQSIPETTSPVLYHRLKQEILHLRDSGWVLIRLAQLKQRMELTLLSERFELVELQAVVGLLAGPGIVILGM